MDIIAHSFKYALHDRHGLKVIWEVKVKVNLIFRLKHHNLQYAIIVYMFISN